jgi:hypothetical protein
MKETQTTKEKHLIRLCHSCSKLSEATVELERCLHCNKSFLPLNYFEKVHGPKKSERYAEASSLDEEDLIQGLFVLW